VLAAAGAASRAVSIVCCTWNGKSATLPRYARHGGRQWSLPYVLSADGDPQQGRAMHPCDPMSGRCSCSDWLDPDVRVCQQLGDGMRGRAHHRWRRGWAPVGPLRRPLPHRQSLQFPQSVRGQTQRLSCYWHPWPMECVLSATAGPGQNWWHTGLDDPPAAADMRTVSPAGVEEAFHCTERSCKIARRRQDRIRGVYAPHRARAAWIVAMPTQMQSMFRWSLGVLQPAMLPRPLVACLAKRMEGCTGASCIKAARHQVRPMGLAPRTQGGRRYTRPVAMRLRARWAATTRGFESGRSLANPFRCANGGAGCGLSERFSARVP
jgi:hypothetical protein